MQELEKIIEKMKEIKDGNRKEKLYAKYPPNSKDQEVLNAYSQGYEDGTDNFYNATAGIIRKHMNDGWIPVERRFPDNAEYILLSFTNFSLPMIGRYEEDPEGGAFYLGDCDENDTCISINLFVNAWMPLPEPYCPEAKAPERKQEWKERMLQNFMKKGEK